jgi:hypothetical protein
MVLANLKEAALPSFPLSIQLLDMIGMLEILMTLIPTFLERHYISHTRNLS